MKVKDRLVKTVDNGCVKDTLRFLNDTVTNFERVRMDPVYYAVPAQWVGCSRIMCRTTDHRNDYLEAHSE
jgi:hypothetical protein